MNRRGWIGWIERNPVTAAVFSFLLGISLAATGFLAAEVGVGPGAPTIDAGVAAPAVGIGGQPGATTGGTTGGSTDGTVGADTTGTGGMATSGGSTTGIGSTSGTGTSGGSTSGGSGGGGGSTSASTSGPTSGSTSGGDGTAGSTAGGSTGANPAACAPDPEYTMTGVTPTEVVIGQITSEVSILPQQFGPVREGLEAFLKRLNEQGGVCGRTIRLDSRNDQANPSSTQSHYESLVGSAFVFVGNTSLQDGQMYNGGQPFDPIASDDGEFLPDIGGFGLSYTRTQSPWFAGPLGSVSPTLVGGVSFKGYRDELAAEGRACTKGGVLFLQEPTGASRDQAMLGMVSIEADWGFGLGPDSTVGYEQQLAASRAQYRLTVQQMLNADVDCVFTYADLQSNVNLVAAAVDEGAWPQADCVTQERCFQLIYQPFAGYDPAFIEDLGPSALGVRTFVPHLPFEEADVPAMRQYLADLEAADPGYAPSTFSVVGYASGAMFADLLANCGARPTRQCMHEGMFGLTDWSYQGLTGPITPYRTSRAIGPDPFGEYDFRWVFNCVNRLKVVEVGDGLAWRRSGPAGYECGDIHVAREF